MDESTAKPTRLKPFLAGKLHFWEPKKCLGRPIGIRISRKSRNSEHESVLERTDETRYTLNLPNR